MIKKHIVNIGFPRTGSTWLWNCAGFEPSNNKENDILTTSLDFDKYINYYKQYQVSANFFVSLWMVDREIIKFVQQHATHISLVVRNPYNFIERFFDWIDWTNLIDCGQDQKTTINYLVTSGYIKYRDIVDRWSTTDANFKVFFFEDLENNPYKFFKQYMEFCQEPIAKNKNIDYNRKINANPKTQKIKLEFSSDQINLINQEIDRFQQVVDRDLTHWKK